MNTTRELNIIDWIHFYVSIAVILSISIWKKKPYRTNAKKRESEKSDNNPHCPCVSHLAERKRAKNFIFWCFCGLLAYTFENLLRYIWTILCYSTTQIYCSWCLFLSVSVSIHIENDPEPICLSVKICWCILKPILAGIQKHNKTYENQKRELQARICINSLDLLAKCNERFGEIMFVIANTTDDDDGDDDEEYKHSDQLCTTCETDWCESQSNVYAQRKTQKYISPLAILYSQCRSMCIFFHWFFCFGRSVPLSHHDFVFVVVHTYVYVLILFWINVGKLTMHKMPLKMISALLLWFRRRFYKNEMPKFILTQASWQHKVDNNNFRPWFPSRKCKYMNFRDTKLKIKDNDIDFNFYVAEDFMGGKVSQQWIDFTRRFIWSSFLSN